VEDTAYNSCLESMYRLHRFGIKLGLDTIRAMLSALDNPQTHFKCIHIAGTNGKGSVAAMLSAILNAAGYKVGRYTSPHLERFNERICIDDRPIADDEVIARCQRVMAIEGLPRQPTFFEFTTAMAFDAFARHQVQWAVIETGMGGRLDATNIVQPQLAVITNISLEHKQYLGKTLPLIAYEKSGIIKPGIAVVSGVRQKSARQAIEQQASAQHADLFLWGRDFRTRRRPDGGFNYIGLDHRWSDIQLKLTGEHQVENAALVLAACELLVKGNHAQITESAIRSGLSNASWPGRLEIAREEPYLILDGAHNLMSARVLGRYLTRHLADRHITLVVGILDDKPYHSILKDLITPCERVIVTQPKIDRAIPVERLETIAKAFNPNVIVKKDVAEAVRYALDTTDPQDAICVAGSLYVVGEAKAALSKFDGAQAKSPATQPTP